MIDMLTRTQLKGIFAERGFTPLKRLGANYLIDGNIKDKVIAEAAAAKGDTVLEIGPGLGALTMDLAASGAEVYAVEIDKKAFALLKEMAADRFPKLKLFHEDILKFDLNKIPAQNKIKVVGNLPYYITTPIIELLIQNRHLVRFALIMVQREVANRLMAPPGTKDCSSISCFIQYYTKPHYIYTIKPTAFYPSPDVDSSLIRLDMRDKPPVDVRDEKLFFRIIRSSFNQRRKSIINSLSREASLNIPKDELSRVLENIGIDPASRPESLSLAEFAKIANSM